jgi:predicted phage terminase large subunit-like protein
VVAQKQYQGDKWDFDSVDVTIDCANKATVRGSNYGILATGTKGQRVFVLEDVTRKGEFHEIVDVVCELIGRWRARRVLIEDKAAGPTLITTLQNAINDGSVKDSDGKPVSCFVERIPANGAFEERIDALAFKIRQGLVFLLDGAEWLEEFVDEFSVYPKGSNDDRLDALAQLTAYLGESTTNLPDW